MQARDNVPLIRALRSIAEARAASAMWEARAEAPAAALGRAWWLESLSQGSHQQLIRPTTKALHDASGDERRALVRALARLFRVQ